MHPVFIICLGNFTFTVQSLSCKCIHPVGCSFSIHLYSTVDVLKFSTLVAFQKGLDKQCRPSSLIRVLLTVHTHYHNSNLIWPTVSHRVDEVIPSADPRRVASRVIQWYGLIHETRYHTPDQVTILIICLLYAFFLTLFLILKPVLVFNPPKKIAGTFTITLHFLTSRQHVFRLWFHASNLLYVTLPQKQVTNVSLVLKDSDMDSENLSSLIRLSVSDGQKTNSSKVVSVIGI